VWKRQDGISGLTGGYQGIQSMTSRGGAPSIIYQEISDNRNSCVDKQGKADEV
jgi:hypothetical protein